MGNNAGTEADVAEKTNTAEILHLSCENGAVVVATPQEVEEPRHAVADFVGNLGKEATDAEKIAIIHQKVPAIEALPLIYEGGQKWWLNFQCRRREDTVSLAWSSLEALPGLKARLSSELSSWNLCPSARRPWRFWQTTTNTTITPLP